ncbi:TIGR01548 family HAD-type hydrolase [Leptolyngbya ohadii]|uniref:TIGR01548 family HAD-type hydrolase n=1 Tax=Leptolyngbya ohadii TaxID=1962290 RepID=UPI001CED19E2|nr:TIGR01548 family HAD-type hydrolase [Leptolyngbya ohadii]
METGKVEGNVRISAQPTDGSAIVVFDIDGVIRDVGNSYRRALADTVEQFTGGAYRPTQAAIDTLKAEGTWNNDWEASQELVYRYFEQQGIDRTSQPQDYEAIVAFFQSRYRGTDPINWNGYICQEPLLVQPDYLQDLTQAKISWGFFSGATRGSATYILEKRLELHPPVLIAMEDAPGKPDPAGLFEVVRQLESRDLLPQNAPVLYAGDTVADMYTVEAAKNQYPDRLWIGVGILPPHAQNSGQSSGQNSGQSSEDYSISYRQTLIDAGAAIVLSNVQQLSPAQVHQLVNSAVSSATWQQF